MTWSLQIKNEKTSVSWQIRKIMRLLRSFLMMSYFAYVINKINN